jgi:UDP-N-acetylglucosamine 2-epimerase (non-hydrolysing)
MLTGIEEILIKESPDVVIVQGDTNSVLAGALAGAKLNIPIAHVEAGLRSYDHTMPEEINRLLAGVIASLHFTPTSGAESNLLKEGISADKIFNVGNTIVDAVLQNVKLAESASTIIPDLKLTDTKYSLVTIHRPENTDFVEKMTTIIDSLAEMIKQHNLKIVWPIHPRTAKQLDTFGLKDGVTSNNNIKLIEPVDFFDMLSLQTHSHVTITDSGGIQEESCILQVPCVTVRNNTERPESVTVKANILAGCDKANILQAVETMLTSDRDWNNPFGNGQSAEKIVTTLISHFNQN